MSDAGMAIKAVNFAFKTARLADAVKKSVIVAAIAVCGYAIYHSYNSR